jgi:hypothetical protein
MNDMSKHEHGLLASVVVGFKEAHELTLALVGSVASTLVSFSNHSLSPKDEQHDRARSDSSQHCG